MSNEKAKHIKNIVGIKYDYLTVIEFSHTDKTHRSFLEVRM